MTWLCVFALACDDGSSEIGEDARADGREPGAGDDGAPDEEGGVDEPPPVTGDHLTEAHCGSEAAYPPGTFVYVGGGGTDGRVGSSPDGLEWYEETTTSRGNSFPGHTRNLVRGAGYGGGVFVLVGGNDNAYVVTTCDGVHFHHDVLRTNVEASPPPEYDNFLSDVAYLDGVFVAVGGAGKRLTSFDHGLTWEETGSFVSGHLREVEAGAGRFVAVGASFDLTRAFSTTSEDGRTWSEPLLSGEPLDRGLAYGAGVFVAVGESRCAVSEDGQRWDACDVDARTFQAVQFVDGRFYLSTSSGVWLSDDGRTYRAAEGVSLPPNLVEGPSGFVFASTSQRGRGDALDGFETRSLDGFRALTGGEVLYVPLLHEERTP